jgi:hypothetical protein
MQWYLIVKGADYMKFVFFAGIFLMSIVASCSKQEFETLMVNQGMELENFAGSHPDSLVVFQNGVWRIILEKGNEDVVAEAGDSLFFDYAAYTFSSGPGLLFDTNILEKAEGAALGHDLNYYATRGTLVGRGKLVAGLDRGLVGAAVGEKCYVAFTARHGFGDVQIGMVPKSSPLIYEVWVKDVKKN